jgi:hypothetical protein
MTLSDRLKSAAPAKTPVLGRPQELSKATEEALVKCLEMCAKFNYPMGRGWAGRCCVFPPTRAATSTRTSTRSGSRRWVKNLISDPDMVVFNVVT